MRFAKPSGERNRAANSVQSFLTRPISGLAHIFIVNYLSFMGQSAGTKGDFLFIAGTRPEAVKLAPVVHALRRTGHNARLLATGQHRDLLHRALADFDLTADIDLDIMRTAQSPAAVVGTLVPAVAELCARTAPVAVIVQGDTASAFAGAQAAAYARAPLAHVEAGLRSHAVDPFPEEMHRRAIAQLADVHFAPSAAAAAELAHEGIAADAIRVTGNTGIDALLWTAARLDADAALARQAGASLADLHAARQRPLLLATVHRRENHRHLPAIVAALRELAATADIAIPVHPHPLVSDAMSGLAATPGIALLPPLAYPSFVLLLRRATLVLTDSGGVQEEAPALGVPVLVLRDGTERPEPLASGNARLVGTDPAQIVSAVRALLACPASLAGMKEPAWPYGQGQASPLIAAELVRRYA